MTIIDPPAAQQPPEEQQWRDDQKSIWERQILVAKCLNFITAFGTAAAMTAAAFAGYSLFILQDSLNKTKEAVDISRKALTNSVEAFKQEHRAYLAIGDNGPSFVYGPLKPNQPIQVNIRYENFGKSPASEIRNHKGIVVANGGIDRIRKLEIPETAPAGGLIPPGAHGILTTPKIPGLTAEQFASFMLGDTVSNNIHIIVYGTISYKDTFFDLHETEFCYQYLTGGLWRYCADHNHMN